MALPYMRPAMQLSLPVPAGTKSGDPVIVGAIAGVAVTNIGEGGNAATHASVDTSPNLWEYEVKNAIAGPGTPVYATARAGATAPILDTTAGGKPLWGYTVPKAGESGVRAGTSGVTTVCPAQI